MQARVDMLQIGTVVQLTDFAISYAIDKDLIGYLDNNPVCTIADSQMYMPGTYYISFNIQHRMQALILTDNILDLYLTIVSCDQEKLE